MSLQKSVFLLLTILLALSVSNQNRNIRSPKKILERIDKIISEDISKWYEDKNLTYPPSCTVLRVFKKEAECEIWAKDETRKGMVKVTTVPVCAMDFRPGPKLREGDGKTPEGFFSCEFHYYSKRWWMWINLRENMVDKIGAVGDGSCFKIFIRYPTPLDTCNTYAAGFTSPGGAIFLHGNCVTAGCISFKNRDFLPVFAFARHHQSRKYGPVQIHIFPFRFDRVDEDKMMQYAKEYDHTQNFGLQNLILFWKNLKLGYDLFNQEKNPLKIKLTSKRVFRKGLSSSVVRDVKVKLKEQGLFNGKIDDFYSEDLEQAVKIFQGKNGLKQDGIIGPQTMKKINIISCRYVFLQND